MNSNDSHEPREPGAPVYDKDSSHAAVPVDANHTLRTDVHEREKAEFGGFKFGSAFFGWLTAMGTTVLLTALVAAIGAAVGLGNGTTPEEAADAATENVGATGIISAIAIGLVLLIAYYAGATSPDGWPASVESSRVSRCGCGRS